MTGPHVPEPMPLDPGACKCGLTLDHPDHIAALPPAAPESGAEVYRKRIADFLNRNGSGFGDARSMKSKSGGIELTYSLSQLAGLDEARAKQAIIDILWQHADKSTCRGCNADIWWITSNANKKTPYDASGQIHFVLCPAREQFKKKGA
jgi:hypothetical protein